MSINRMEIGDDGVAREVTRSDTDDAAIYGAPQPPTPTPPPTVTGNQWGLSVADLGLASAWLAGVAKSKAKDQLRIGLIARDTRLAADDPLLIRVAGNAGVDASNKPLVDVSTVIAHAQSMST